MITTEEKKKGKCLWTPTPKQSEFLSSSFDEVLYGGSAGGGKSDALLIDMLGLDQHSLVWPRYRAILFRKTFPELSELVDRSKEIYPSIFQVRYIIRQITNGDFQAERKFYSAIWTRTKTGINIRETSINGSAGTS